MNHVTEEDEMNLPEAKEVRVEQKRFYFDVGSNIRGVFVRLSEVRKIESIISVSIADKRLNIKFHITYNISPAEE